MRRLLTSALLAAAAVVLAATSASAATWHVDDGGVITLTSTNLTLRVQDPSGGQTLPCQSSSITINIPDGDSDGQPIGQVIGWGVNNCSLSGVISFTIQISGFPYGLDADAQNGDISGRITGPITAQISSSVGCSATITGTTIPVTYDNNLITLHIPGTGQDLTLSNVNTAGCQNLLHDGDQVAISGDFDNVTHPVIITPL